MLCGHARAFNNPPKKHAGNSHSFGKRECRLKGSEKELFPEPKWECIAPYGEPIQSYTTEENCKPIANSSPFKG